MGATEPGSPAPDGSPAGKGHRGRLTGVRKVYSSHDGLLVGLLAELLGDQGIPCVVKNAYLAGASGEIPPTECWPELWVADDRDAGPAARLVEAYLAYPAEPLASWTCPACGEPIEGQFTACWRCGHARPEAGR